MPLFSTRPFYRLLPRRLRSRRVAALLCALVVCACAFAGCAGALTKRIKESPLYGREYTFNGSRDHAVLLIHGFNQGPEHMRPLAAHLHEQGFTCQSVLLPGHCGDTSREMIDVSWRDWYRAVEARFLALRAGHATVSVVGFSLGGLLALRLAEEHNVDHVITISTPITFVSDKLPANWAVKHLSPIVPWVWLHRKEYRVTLDGAEHTLYSHNFYCMPSCAGREVQLLIEQVQPNLHRVRADLLVVQATREPGVDADSALIIHDCAASQRKCVQLHDSRDHVLLLGAHKTAIENNIAQFLLDTPAASGRRHATPFGAK